LGLRPKTCAGGQDAPGSVEPGEVTTWTTCGMCRVRPQTPVPGSRSPALGGTQIGPWPQVPFMRHRPACPPAPCVRSVRRAGGGFALTRWGSLLSSWVTFDSGSWCASCAIHPRRHDRYCLPYTPVGILPPSRYGAGPGMRIAVSVFVGAPRSSSTLRTSAPVRRRHRAKRAGHHIAMRRVTR
jgi:hypothetical protein